MSIKLNAFCTVAALICLHALVPESTERAAAAEVSYTKDVLPILSRNCLHCHGQDPSHRNASLRLDCFESPSDDAFGSEHVIERGDPEQSEFFARVTAEDAELRMPPVDSGKVLKPAEIEVLRNWIAQGARYEPHWAFVTPRRPELPRVKNQAWPRNAIDLFVLSELERENLSPSPPAPRHTLLRRLSLDLTGLPPTVEELEAFEANESPDALQCEIERLLASPHFGERWARTWLDAARYADSDGFEKDKPRQVWVYRDWVINALNRDMGYDQFIVEQLAGDLLPDQAPSHQLATGFLRNSMFNDEGGVDPEQSRMEAMFDRMDAIGKSVLGLTLQCAQCHTHKYDPIEHTDYYRLMAFINNCEEGEVTTYTEPQMRQWTETIQVVRDIEAELKAAEPAWREKLLAWEQSVQCDDVDPWQILRPELDGSGEQKHKLLDDGSVLAQGYAPTKPMTEFAVNVPLKSIKSVRLELLNDPNLPRGGPGRSVEGLCALTEFEVWASPIDRPNDLQRVKIACVSADMNPPERELAAMFDDLSGKRRVTGGIELANDGDFLTAWGIDAGPGRSNVPRQAAFTFETPIESQAGVRLTFRLLQFHGSHHEASLTQNLGRFRFAATDRTDAVADTIPASVRQALCVSAVERTEAQEQEIFAYWRSLVPEWAEANRRIEALWQSHPRGTSQLVLIERESPRATHLLERGDFLKQAEKLTPATPKFLHSLNLEGEREPNRLDFARWLVDKRSPTTARSIVNRIWQGYFGVGFVATADDFGTQGELPSHPQLLDWLAIELMDHDWSLKHIHRLIVSSATYQQRADLTPEMLRDDPANRRLARGPRFRVDAEVVRDVALAASGLLSDEVGGPSVYPPAPEFLFKPPASFMPKVWDHDAGRDRYRRGLYTFRYRSVPYPALENFDAPKGDVSCVRRIRSNTPLQALTTLNEPLSMECARALARKIVTEGGASDAKRLTYAMRRCAARSPAPEELAMLLEFLELQKQRFANAATEAWTLIAGDAQPAISRLPENVSPDDMAAWTATARVLLNLDEVITKD